MTNPKTVKTDLISLYHYTISTVLIWTAIIAASLAWNYRNEHWQMRELALKEALTVYHKDLAFRLWGTKHGGVYVPVTEEMPPNKYLKNIPERDITIPSGKKLTLINPAFMMRQVMADYAELYGVRGHITSLKLNNPDNAPDEWERRALEHFEDGTGEVVEIVPSAGNDQLRLMRPMVTKEGCLKCHGDQGYKVGDVRGGIAVAVDMSAYQALTQNHIRSMAVTHGLIWLFGLFSISFISQRTKRRLIERKLAETELRKYEHVISATNDHMSFIDQNYIYQAVNAAHMKAHKKTRREIIGHPVSELIADDPSGPLIKEKLDRCLAGQEIHYHVWFTFAGSGRRYMKMAYYPFRDIDESVSGIIVSGHDITEQKWKEDELRRHHEHLEELVAERTSELALSLDEMTRQQISTQNMALALKETNKKLVGEIKERKQAEENLKLSESKLRSTLTSMDDYVFVFDTESRFIDFFSASKELLKPPEEFIGKRHSEVMPPYIDKLFVKAFDWNKTGRVADFEYQLETDGKLFSYSTKLSPMFIDDEFTGTVAVTRDITESKQAADNLKKARKAAEAASRVKSEFLANMSHEIRTPMNAILGFSEILEGKIRNEQHRQYLALIRASGKSLMTLINDILDLSKIEAGKMKLKYEPINPVFVFKEIAGMFSQKIEHQGLKFVLETDQNLPEYLFLDEARLRQILFNLVGNAVKFTESGTIKLTAKTRIYDEISDVVDFIFAVEDTGIGIPEDQKTTIFNAFEQQSGQDHATYGGTGLGLAITKRLAVMMGGVISVSGEKGQGSTFTVTLKNVRKTGVADTPGIKTDISVDSIIFDKAVILIVDDIKPNLMLLIGLLQDYGFEFIMAENGTEACDLARRRRPDLILMDMKMPVMNGYEATKILKAGDYTKAIPIIAVTAAAMKDTEKEISALCDGYLKKPIKETDLVHELARFLKHTFEEPSSENTKMLTKDVDICSQETFTPKIHARVPEMIHILETSFLPKWEEINGMVIMDDVKQFATELKSVAREYRVQPLITYGDNLYRSVQSYDVVEVKKLLKGFPKLVERYKKEYEKISSSY